MPCILLYVYYSDIMEPETCAITKREYLCITLNNNQLNCGARELKCKRSRLLGMSKVLYFLLFPS